MTVIVPKSLTYNPANPHRLADDVAMITKLHEEDKASLAIIRLILVISVLLIFVIPVILTCYPHHVTLGDHISWATVPLGYVSHVIPCRIRHSVVCDIRHSVLCDCAACDSTPLRIGDADPSLSHFSPAPL